MTEPGFIFWGLFLVCGAIVVAYVGWMKWVEQGDEGREEG